MDERAAREKLEAIGAKYRRYESYVRFLASQAKANDLWGKYGEKLCALFLRIKQGPIRMVIVGESSTGKSTLVNAFAGDFVAPENAGVCTAKPIYMMRHDEPRTYVYPYSTDGSSLPAVHAVGSTGRLLTLQYGAKAATAIGGGEQNFVYVGSETMPRGVTLVDTPGLNAGKNDTKTTLGLFSVPAYAAGGERDVPEIILFLTRQQNLLQTELDALSEMKRLGADIDGCLLVHNDFTQGYMLTPETFETVNQGAVEGLTKSLAALLGGDAPDAQSAAEPEHAEPDPWDFDSYLDEEDDEENAPQVFSLNAMLARMQYVRTDNGVYDVLKYPPEGMTMEEFASWKVLSSEETTQTKLARIRDAFVEQGGSGYAPMIDLVAGVERRALALAQEEDRLCDVLSAADALGEALLEDCVQHMKRREPQVTDGTMDALKELLEQARDLTRDFSAEDSAFREGLKKAAEVYDKAAQLHNGKVKLAAQSLLGRKFGMVDIAAMVMGQWFAPLMLVPLYRFLTQEDLTKEYNKLIKEKGLGGRDLDALFDGEPSDAGVGALVQIIRDLGLKLSYQMLPDRAQILGMVTEAILACTSAVVQTNAELREIGVQLTQLTGRMSPLLNAQIGDTQALADDLTQGVMRRHPRLSLPDADELADAVRAAMHAMKAKGEVRRMNVKSRVYKEIIAPVLSRAVEEMHMEVQPVQQGELALIEACYSPAVSQWSALEEEIRAAIDRQRTRQQSRIDEREQRLAAKRAELAARFEQAKSAHTEP